MKFMIWLAVVLSAALALGQAHVKVVDNSTRSSSLQVATGSLPPQLQAEELQVTITFSDGQVSNGDLLVLYESDNGLFWWRYQNSATDSPGGILARFNAYSIPYLTGQKIVCFISEGTDLLVRDSAEQASSLDDAVTMVLAELQNSEADINLGGFGWFNFVSLSDIVQAGLLDPGESPNPYYQLTGVTLNGSQWQVGLQDASGNSATLYLSDDYQLVGIQGPQVLSSKSGN